MDESMSEFLDSSLWWLTENISNKDAIEPDDMKKCSEMYIKLLEKAFESYDQIISSLKESIPGYNKKDFGRAKCLQLRLKQLLTKSDSLIHNRCSSCLNINNVGQDSSRPHCATREVHNSEIPRDHDCMSNKSERNGPETQPITPKKTITSTSDSVPHKSTAVPQPQVNKRPSTDSVNRNEVDKPRNTNNVQVNKGRDTNIRPEVAETVRTNASEQVKEDKILNEDSSCPKVVKNNDVQTAERKRATLVYPNPLAVTQASKFAPAPQSSVGFHQQSSNIPNNRNIPSTDSFSANKGNGKLSAENDVNRGNKNTNMTSAATTGNLKNYAVASTSKANAVNSSISVTLKKKVVIKSFSTEIIVVSDDDENECKNNSEGDNYEEAYLDDETDVSPEATEAGVDGFHSVASTSYVLDRSEANLVDEDDWLDCKPEKFEDIKNDGTTDEFVGVHYPHSEQMMRELNERFGIQAFRPNQLKVINAVMLKNDCFVLMPTGGGKSLCYQLPALLTPGVTIVISPLKSLILDQVNQLKTLRIPVANLSGDLSQNESVEIYRKLSQDPPDFKLVYVTPEKISSSFNLKSSLKQLYSRGQLARFVIDEAHCISQWGNDFRPDYKRLGELRAEYPDTNIIALTATAKPRVRTDIEQQLQLRSCKWFLSSFNRPNLTYRILEKTTTDFNKNVVEVIKKNFYGLSGIVYCISKKDCEALSTDLCKAGVLAEYYHAGCRDKKRNEVQADWLADKCQVICATIAFGMGVDKAGVRFVIHLSMPKSVEGYYQETGRAGRDGDQAICQLYYSYADVLRQIRLLNRSSNGTEETKRVHMGNIMRMMKICESFTECRREQVLAYLGERYDREQCVQNQTTACDNCLGKNHYQVEDVTEHCKVIARCIRENCASSFTLMHMVEALHGSVKARLQELQNTPLHGLLKTWTQANVSRLLRQLLLERCLAHSVIISGNNIHIYVKEGPNVDKLLNGELKILFRNRDVKVPPSHADAGCATDEPIMKRARLDEPS